MKNLIFTAAVLLISTPALADVTWSSGKSDYSADGATVKSAHNDGFQGDHEYDMKGGTPEDDSFTYKGGHLPSKGHKDWNTEGKRQKQHDLRRDGKQARPQKKSK